MIKQTTNVNQTVTLAIKVNKGGSSDQPGDTGGNSDNQPIVKDGTVTFNSNAFKGLKKNGKVTINLNQTTDFSVHLTKDQVKDLKAQSGHLSVTNQNVTIDFPASNLPDSGDIQFNVQKLKDMSQAFSGVYSFSIISGKTSYHHFGSPVTLTFKVNQKDVKNPDQLKVYYYNEQTKKWELIGGTYKDGYVTATTMHFSTYTVFRQTSSTTSQSSSDTGTQSAGTPQLPNTGTPYYNFLAVGVALILIGGIAVLVRRRQRVSE